MGECTIATWLSLQFQCVELDVCRTIMHKVRFPHTCTYWKGIPWYSWYRWTTYIWIHSLRAMITPAHTSYLSFITLLQFEAKKFHTWIVESVILWQNCVYNFTLCVKFYTVFKAFFRIPIGKFYTWLIFFYSTSGCDKYEVCMPLPSMGSHLFWASGTDWATPSTLHCAVLLSLIGLFCFNLIKFLYTFFFESLKVHPTFFCLMCFVRISCMFNVLWQTFPPISGSVFDRLGLYQPQ